MALDNSFKIGFDFINNTNRGFYFTSESLRILLTGFDIHFRCYSLSCNLYESKLTWWEYFMLGSVVFHFISELIEETFSDIWIIHIYEINNYDSPHVPRSQLSGILCCCNYAYCSGTVFLSSCFIWPVPAISLYIVESFCMFHNQISTLAHRDGFTERSFYLSFDA